MIGAWWPVALIAAFATSCDPAWARSERRSLPAPSREGGTALATALATRRSVRAYGARGLDDAELGQLLWAAQGTTDGHRSVPSAGALYPLTVWIADARGVWRYLPDEHALAPQRTDDRRSRLASAGYAQASLGGAPVIVVITGEVSITARKYGRRAERFVTLEAGHAAQNLLLTATALGLGAVPIGAFDDRAVLAALDLPREVLPLYLIAVGAR